MQHPGHRLLMPVGDLAAFVHDPGARADRRAIPQADLLARIVDVQKILGARLFDEWRQAVRLEVADAEKDGVALERLPLQLLPRFRYLAAVAAAAVKRHHDAPAAEVAKADLVPIRLRLESE